MPATVTLTGHLGADPVLEGEGTARRARLRVATRARAKVDGEWTDVTTWWSVTAWGRHADFAGRSLTKGSAVEVVGEVSTREYTGRDGATRTSLDVQADRVTWPASDRADRPEPAPERTRAPAREPGSGSGRRPPTPGPDDDSDLPF